MKNNYSLAERNRIVEEYLPYVEWVIRKNRALMKAAKLEYDDVYQQLSLRLVKAVCTYDPDKGELGAHIWAQLHFELMNCKRPLRTCGMTGLPKDYRRGNIVSFESIREVTADVDEVKLSLALNNLVENAIKYNVEGGWVRVTLDADHKFFYVKVADSGIGISEEFQEHIFERFYRVDKARSRETGGTGLGLAITKNIILMHQGAIRLTSKEGEGTTFTVRIPLTYIP